MKWMKFRVMGLVLVCLVAVATGCDKPLASPPGDGKADVDVRIGGGEGVEVDVDGPDGKKVDVDVGGGDGVKVDAD